MKIKIGKNRHHFIVPLDCNETFNAKRNNYLFLSFLFFCLGLNRRTESSYANVVPLPETRVILQRINDDPKTEYINANYVRVSGWNYVRRNHCQIIPYIRQQQISE